MARGVKANIGLLELEQLGQLQPTDPEVAAFFGISTRAWMRWKRKKGYKEALERGREKGMLSIRREQYKQALDGNITMLIWLGKQQLGQTDKRHIEQEITHKKSVAELSDEELMQVIQRDNISDIGRRNGSSNGAAHAETGT